MTTLNISVTDKYKDEEVDSSYGYLSGYTVKPWVDQVATLKQLYPQLNDDGMMTPGELPAGAEGWFAIPNIWKKDSLLTGTYNDSLRRVLEMIKSDRNGKFYNYREGKIGPKRLLQTAHSLAVGKQISEGKIGPKRLLQTAHSLAARKQISEGQIGPKCLRQTEHSLAAWKQISEDQGHPDILVIPEQFGITHRGRSVRRAREVMLGQSQFGLGSFVTGIMLLTHPERLQHYDDLWIYCAGDEYDDPDADARFDRAPFFGFSGCEVRFGSVYVGLADDRGGSASGFLSQ